jgi:uncharacterized phage protein (TIGR01671 family)
LRKIKFRVWDTELKEFATDWTNRDPFFLLTTGQLFFYEKTKILDGTYGSDRIVADYGSRFIMQQYTGLSDSGDKEIYEGDILTRYKEVALVDFNSDNYSSILGWNLLSLAWEINGEKICSEKSKDGKYPPVEYYYGQSPNEEWTIIGNIYENPELLK